MKNTKDVLDIINALECDYPDPTCSLQYTNDYELLFATRLSAQCTDERVNMITPALFKAYPTLEAFAEAKVEDVEQLIKSCGFYHTKARDLIGCAVMLLTQYGGKVPDNMEDLLKLPGIGRKTANLVLGDIYNVPSSVVCDTHCIRITNKLGMSQGKDPAKVEAQLRSQLPPDKSSDFCHRMVLHGRAVCSARKPRCEICSLNQWCDEFNGKL